MTVTRDTPWRHLGAVPYAVWRARILDAGGLPDDAGAVRDPGPDDQRADVDRGVALVQRCGRDPDRAGVRPNV